MSIAQQPADRKQFFPLGLFPLQFGDRDEFGIHPDKIQVFMEKGSLRFNRKQFLNGSPGVSGSVDFLDDLFFFHTRYVADCFIQKIWADTKFF